MFIKTVGDSVPRTSVLKTKHHPASNTNAVVTLTGAAGLCHVIHGVQWGYDGTPTGGALTITIGGTTEFAVPITAGGPGSFQFTLPASVNSTVAVTLAAGGNGVTGKLNVQYSSEPSRAL